MVILGVSLLNDPVTQNPRPQALTIVVERPLSAWLSLLLQEQRCTSHLRLTVMDPLTSRA